MKTLSRMDEVLLIMILKLGDNAYGVSIRDRVERDLGEKWSFGSIYPALERIARMNIIRRTKGDPIAERGGKSRFYYRVTASGLRALKQVRKTREMLWSDLPVEASEAMKKA